MTNSELIARLQTFPPDAKICVSLIQGEYADMSGIDRDGIADDVYLETWNGRNKLFISGSVEE